MNKERAEKRRLYELNPNKKLVGSCTEKCPEYERHERELHLDLSPFEMVGFSELHSLIFFRFQAQKMPQKWGIIQGLIILGQ